MDLIHKLEKISFLFPIGVVLMMAIGFLIKHYFFSKKDTNNSTPFIKAGSHISAGGVLLSEINQSQVIKKI